MGCSLLTPEPEIVTVTNTVKTVVQPVASPKPVVLNDINIYVVTTDTYDSFIQEFTNTNGSDAYVAISIKDYENLSLNIAELKRYIQQQKNIIVYYEAATTPD